VVSHDADRLFQRIGEYIDEWQAYEAAYRRHVVGLLGSQFGPGSDPADADLGGVADLVLHTAQLVTMHGMIHSLLGVLEAWDEDEVIRYQLAEPTESRSDSAEA